ncbi:hypothetical protein NPIL_89041 [Nephila pilipes]|uniref:Secreted protein n=1 Tax=Nephila pilipes TaxID=299642 RepID=A0A8X6Q8Y4_NEPPI|nr:hypothetical protein NPIL_89041 [Nephila pilipes]
MFCAVQLVLRLVRRALARSVCCRYYLCFAAAASVAASKVSFFLPKNFFLASKSACVLQPAVSHGGGQRATPRIYKERSAASRRNGCTFLVTGDFTVLKHVPRRPVNLLCVARCFERYLCASGTGQRLTSLLSVRGTSILPENCIRVLSLRTPFFCSQAVSTYTCQAACASITASETLTTRTMPLYAKL